MGKKNTKSGAVYGTYPRAPGPLMIDMYSGLGGNETKNEDSVFKKKFSKERERP